jgi:hypothetical protein
LGHIEDGEAFLKRNRLRFLTSFVGTPAFVIRREPVGIDDGCSLCLRPL